jgi:signal transduction histidine kinase
MSASQHPGHSSADAMALSQHAQGDTVCGRCRTLGRLAGFVVHEIRNPLTTIALYGDIIESDLQHLPGEQQAHLSRALHTMRQEVTRLDELIQHYLWLARLPELSRTPEEFGEYLETWAWELQGQLVPHRIALHIEGLKNLGLVVLHKRVFQRLLQCLVQRAIAAMPQGGMFTVHGQRTASGVYLALSDTGNAIPAEQLARLFKLPAPTTSEKFDLSLYMVYAIITAHEGTVSVVSAPGMDTTFTLRLPAYTAGQQA